MSHAQQCVLHIFKFVLSRSEFILKFVTCILIFVTRFRVGVFLYCVICRKFEIDLFRNTLSKCEFFVKMCILLVLKKGYSTLELELVPNVLCKRPGF
jgi:hypothetical protein